MKSHHAILLIAAIWFAAGAFFYPKWNFPKTEATISWDVSGYYHYLPAIFIYKDIRYQTWMEDINQKYLPSTAFDQAYDHPPSGNKINKYAIGQALLYSPFFLLAHAYTSFTDAYPADGYSKPYQIAIWLGGLLFSILGLILLRSVLLHFFADPVVMWTLMALGLGTHWLEYAAITNGMNHTWLFTLLCALLLFTIRFYQKPTWIDAIGIGASMGLAVLTRPPEAVWVLIPLLWNWNSIQERISFISSHWKKVLTAIAIAGGILSLQLLYWKYAGGEWLIYTYRDQGFDWLHPKVWRGLMGVNIGWWAYTPIMLFAMFGWYGWYKKSKSLFAATFIPAMLCIYLTLSWAHFESGGGLGQRNLIQMYPLMAFPLATLIAWFIRHKVGYGLWVMILIFNVYYNMWWSYQAHKGGFFHAGQMTTPFFYNVVGRLPPDRDYLKLLDTREYFHGTPYLKEVILENDFEADSISCQREWPAGGKAGCLSENHQYYGPINLDIKRDDHTWIRLEADFITEAREWNLWHYAQWIVQFSHQGENIKTNMIKVQRLMPYDMTPTHIFFDVKLPDAPFDQSTMTLWNADSDNTVLFDNLKISGFDR